MAVCFPSRSYERLGNEIISLTRPAPLQGHGLVGVRERSRPRGRGNQGGTAKKFVPEAITGFRDFFFVNAASIGMRILPVLFPPDFVSKT